MAKVQTKGGKHTGKHPYASENTGTTTSSIEV